MKKKMNVVPARYICTYTECSKTRRNCYIPPALQADEDHTQII